MRWQPIEGLICAGGPVHGCIFALQAGSFGVPGLVLVGFGDQVSCGDLVNSKGFVSLPVDGIAANIAPDEVGDPSTAQAGPSIWADGRQSAVAQSPRRTLDFEARRLQREMRQLAVLSQHIDQHPLAICQLWDGETDTCDTV